MNQQEIIAKMERLKPGEKMIYHRGATGDIELEDSLKEIRKATWDMRELESHIFVQRKTGRKFQINGRDTSYNEYEYIIVGR